MRKARFFPKIYIVLSLLFLYAPIFVLIAFSFNESKSRAYFTGFTFKWYKELVQNEAIMSALFNSLLIAFLSSIIATVMGTIAAIGINSLSRRKRGFVMNLTYIPVLNPEIVTGISMMLLFVFFKQLMDLPLGFYSLLISHVTFCLPYPILNVLPKLRQMDPSLYEAALDLGCPPLQSFFKVVVPQILSGIVSGFLMSFTYSLDDFVITYFTSGSGFSMLPVTIYSMVRKKVNPQINALSAIIFLLVLALLIGMNIAEAKKAKKE